MHVQTVRRSIDPARLGLTLPAEHFYIQQWEVLGHEALYQLEDDDVFADEIAAFQALGGACIVDTTPPCIGRRPDRLRDLSERTGIDIVMSCGWYLEAYVPPEDRVERRSVQSLADQLIAEIRGGVADTGIRPGVIGEFGASKGFISPMEERIHRASARAHRATGIPMTTHALHSPIGLEQLELFEEEGADLTHVAIGHCDSFPHLPYWLAVIERGAFVQLDNIGEQMGRHEERLAGLVRDVVERGHERHLLLSHDMGVASELRYHGGRGLTYLFEAFLPRLRDLGVSEEVIRVITVDNPGRFLSMPD